MRNIINYGTDPFSASASCGCPSAGIAGAYAENKPARITSPSGREIEFHYDLSWRLTSRIEAPGTSEEAMTLYTYDALGNMLTVTDPRAKPRGQSHNL